VNTHPRALQRGLQGGAVGCWLDREHPTYLTPPPPHIHAHAGIPAPSAELLPWGDDAALDELLTKLAECEAGTSVALVILADCVYGSNPGVWERLVATLTRVCGPNTMVLQV
jgi:hypothetical protein